MHQLVLRSPAKVNLYLDVLDKRPDGYHNIETLFEKISLFDTISIRAKKNGIKITVSNPGLPVDKRNLAYRAAQLLFAKTGFKKGAHIDITKRIPLSSGLGGGSSNAAIALIGLNRFFKLGLNRQELIRLGSLLGADVPFFLHQGVSFAVGRGRGDKIRPLKVYKNTNIWHILVLFNFGISTKEAYTALSLGLTPMRRDVKILTQFVVKNAIENLGDSLYNRLEEPALKRFDAIKRAKQLLLMCGAYGALLSGSGSALFGITKTREEAVAVKRGLGKALRGNYNLLIAKTFNE